MPITNKAHLHAQLCLAAFTLCLFIPVLASAQSLLAGSCGDGLANCFLSDDSSPALSHDAAASDYSLVSPTLRVVNMYVRTLHGGPFAHHWIEVGSSRGEVTIGYGPAALPFIDAGQISVWDEHGNIEKTGMHFISTGFNYAKPPGSGRVVGKPIQLTVAQSDALIARQSRRKFLFPYIPIFHDCHTFVCTVKASVQGKSTLPCYLLFKGYW